MLFRVASILVACTASEAIAPERILKRKLAKTPAALTKFVEFIDEKFPLNLKSQELVRKMKGLGGAGDILPKIVAITTALTILCDPIMYSLHYYVKRRESSAKDATTLFGHLQQTCFYTTYFLLAAMNGVGLWKIKSNRVNYGIMLGVLSLSWIWALLEDNSGWVGPVAGLLRDVVDGSDSLKGWGFYMIELPVMHLYWAVALFNWAKVLLPVFSKWVDSMEKKLK